MSLHGRPSCQRQRQLLTLILACTPVLLQAQADPCIPANFDGQVSVRHVIDGDTVVLADGRRLRLVGIDTPELANDQHPAEPLADQARNFLSTLVQQAGPALYFVTDREQTDGYGRTLAHLFLPDRSNVQSLILQAGLATPLSVPPNLLFIDCYRDNTRVARQAQRGLWDIPGYQVVDVSTLQPQERGYRIVRGTVTRIGDSRTSVWLNLGDGFALRIVKSDIAFFSGLDISSLHGNTVQASGELYVRNGQLRMRIRHPADLLVLTE